MARLVGAETATIGLRRVAELFGIRNLLLADPQQKLTETRWLRN